jgi:DNA-binding CsgD family transcriptional regulator
MSIILPKESIFLSSTNDVEAICKPFFEKNDIEFFQCVRIFDDGFFYILSTSTEWINYFCEKEYSPVTPYPTEFIQKKFHYLIPTHGPYSHVVHDARNFFKIAYPLNFVEQGDGYVDMFCFASNSCAESIVNYYLNNIDALENFILEFKEKTNGLQPQLEQQKIFLPNHMRTNMNSKGIIDLENTHEKIIQLERKQAKNNKWFTINNRRVSLTRREMECLNKLTLGYSAKEIALSFSLSHRTVEDHIQNAKAKLGCSKRSEIARILLSEQEKSRLSF